MSLNREIEKTKDTLRDIITLNFNQRIIPHHPDVTLEVIYDIYDYQADIPFTLDYRVKQVLYKDNYVMIMLLHNNVPFFMLTLFVLDKEKLTSLNCWKQSRETGCLEKKRGVDLFPLFERPCVLFGFTQSNEVFESKLIVSQFLVNTFSECVQTCSVNWYAECTGTASLDEEMMSSNILDVHANQQYSSALGKVSAISRSSEAFSKFIGLKHTCYYHIRTLGKIYTGNSL